MLRHRAALVVSVLAVAVLLIAPAARAAENPVGTWVGTTDVPDHGTDQVTLILKKAEGAYNGTITDSLGMVAQDISDVRFEDGVLSFSFALTDGAAMKMTLKVTGDKMTGEWTHPGGDVGAIVLERKKAQG